MMSKWFIVPMSLILLSSVVSLSTNQWTMMWLLLELNTMSFILNLLQEKNKESIILFFIFQTMSSMVIMVYLFNMNSLTNQNSVKTMVFMILTAIMLKTGMFPFHTWMLEMSKYIYWINITLMLTWQKIIPLIMMIKMTSKMNTIKIILMSMFLMLMVMMSMSKSKKILISSSLIHNGWMMLSMKFMKTIPMVYISIYSFIILIINSTFMKNNFNKLLNQMKEKTMKIDINIMMFSMAGIPPTMGFVLKMMVIFSMMSNKIYLSSIILLILISSMSFLVYFQFFNKMMNLFPNNTMKNFKMKKNSKNMMTWANIMIPTMMMF